MCKKISVLFVCFLFSIKLYAQSVWSTRGTLFQDKDIKVDVEFKLSNLSCNTAGEPSSFRYKITGKTKSSDFFINWMMDYYDCKNEVVAKSNYLKVDQSLAEGILENPGWEFNGSQVANFMYSIEKSTNIIAKPVVPQKYSNSIEAISINGNFQINNGESTILTVLGGTLGIDATWKWYSDDCGGTLVGSGKSITISPRNNTTYFVRAEGKNITSCVSAPIVVTSNNVAADRIIGRTTICKGEGNISLSVSGGQVGLNSKWIWYEGDCNGKKIGEGLSIEVSPIQTTQYYVRAEGPTNSSDCKSISIKVSEPSEGARNIGGPDKVNYNEVFKLQVNGGKLGDASEWVWYIGAEGSKRKVGTGNVLDNLQLTQSGTYSLRSEGGCDNTEFVVKYVEVTPQPVARVIPEKPIRIKTAGVTQKPAIFINAGINTNNVEEMQTPKNFSVTVGSGRKLGLYARIKFSIDESKGVYETDNSALINYNTTGYYRFNGNNSSKRTGYTGGLFFGGKTISVYLGGGYGTRELWWGLDEGSYQDANIVKKSWAKNMQGSFKGTEVEGGVLLRLGVINVMAGMSTINVMAGMSTINFDYKDIQIGIGFNIK